MKIKASKNTVKAQWRPASQPHRVRQPIQQLPGSCAVAGENDRTIRSATRALTECDATFKRALPIL